MRATDEHGAPVRGDGKGDVAVTADREEPFGQHRTTRFGADVRYPGRVQGHDYEVEARHRLRGTTTLVIVDGVRHEAKAEQELAAVTGAAAVDTEDGLVVRLVEGFTRNRYVVRRPTGKGMMRDREAIAVRTTGLGGAGEIDVIQSEELRGTPLVPEGGSPSASRVDATYEGVPALAAPDRGGSASSASTSAGIDAMDVPSPTTATHSRSVATASEEPLRRDASVLPGSEDPGHQICADSQNWKRERYENQHPDQPHVESEFLGKAFADTRDNATRSAPETDAAKGVEESAHVLHGTHAGAGRGDAP